MDESFVLLGNAARRGQAGQHVVPDTVSYVCPVLHAAQCAHLHSFGEQQVRSFMLTSTCAAK